MSELIPPTFGQLDARLNVGLKSKSQVNVDTIYQKIKGNGYPAENSFINYSFAIPLHLCHPDNLKSS